VSNFPVYILALLAVCTIAGFFVNRNVARTRLMAVGGGIKGGWHSQANYHGLFTAWLIGIGGIAVFISGLFMRSDASGMGFHLGWLALLLIFAAAATLLCSKRITADFRARTYVERLIQGVLIALSVVAVLTTFGIVMSLAFESWRFFEQVPLNEFLFGLQWSPQTALRADQAGSSGAFGAVPIFAGTFLIMLVAMAVAGPIGLMIAIYLAEYAHPTTRKIVKPMIEILAGIPTVVYGFFALLTVGPTIRNFAETLGFAVPTQSAIAAGVVMGIMIVPLISSLSDDVITAVPQSLRDGSLALGATKSETMKQVIFAGALPGIIGAFLLAISRRRYREQYD